MGCCGDNKKKGRIKVAEDIVEGAARRLWPASEMARWRMEICDGCDKSTWFTLPEYLAWLAENGIKVFKNFAQLEKLPPLEIKEYHTFAELYCSICKCNLDGKTRVPDSECLLDHWKVLDSVLTKAERIRRFYICCRCSDNRLEVKDDNRGLRGVCRLSRGFYPTAKPSNRQVEAVLPNGEPVVIEEMTGDCLADKWALTDT